MTEHPTHPNFLSDSAYSTAKNLADGEATVRDNVERLHTDAEQSFVAAVDSSLAADGAIRFHVANPSGSGRNCYFYFGELTHEGAVSATLHTDVSSTVTVAAADVSNNYIGSSVSSVVTAETVDSTFSSADTHFSQIYFGSGTESIFDGYRITVPPGEAILLEVGDQSSASNEVGVRFAWAESSV